MSLLFVLSFLFRHEVGNFLQSAIVRFRLFLNINDGFKGDGASRVSLCVRAIAPFAVVKMCAAMRAFLVWCRRLYRYVEPAA